MVLTAPTLRPAPCALLQAQGHYVCQPNATAKQRGLFLFIPGTSPNIYTQIVETAASAGFHAVGIQWDGEC